MPPILPIIDRVVPGEHSYVLPGMLPLGGTPGIARVWKFQQIPRSSMWAVGGVVKTRNQFDGHLEPESLLALLDEAAGRNVTRPSSYGDLFHDTYKSPKLPGPVARAVGMFEVAGGWQEMLKPSGRYPGLWRKYDLRSAYLWATAQGLPNPKTFRYSEHFGTKPGLYLCDILPALHAPYPFRGGGRLAVTPEEVDRYQLTVTRIWHGITWTDAYDIEPILRNVLSWSCKKYVARGFWGRWASRGVITCATYKNQEKSKEWELPLFTFNPIWAHLIVSRVRARVFEATKQGETARVYVDSVITTAELPTDQGNLGDWKLEETLVGLDIRGLNRYSSVA